MKEAVTPESVAYSAKTPVSGTRDIQGGGTVVEVAYDDSFTSQQWDQWHQEAAELEPLRRPSPVKHKWNLIPCLLFICCMGSGSYYFYVRFSQMVGLLHWSWWPTTFLVLELWAVTSFVPYAILVTRGVYPTGSPGLPAKDSKEGQLLANELPCMHVRVLVPTYRESLTCIEATVRAALAAALPPNVKRTVYLLDDGKDPEKKAFIQSLSSDYDAVYVSGRTRKPGEVNGKSANLNFCLRAIYASESLIGPNGEPRVEWSEISNRELIVVFDADMCAKNDFFLKILETMLDEDIALCLTPQAFHNISPATDLFNNINCQFWEYWLPGAFSWGYIACTGTNFCIRARALAHCGLFPEYTITEDYALGMELKSRGYKATYLMQYLAEGEAPEEIRNIFRQRSRWTKGHFQVFFSRKCPLLNWDLPAFQRLWYSYAAWAPLCTSLTVPGIMIAPFMSIAFGLHPLAITYHFVLASTLYFSCVTCIQYYVHTATHLRLMWFANFSNTVLWFTYTKALINTIFAKMGFKAMVFKVTEKVKPQAGVALPVSKAPLTPGAKSPGTVTPKGHSGPGDMTPGSVLSRALRAASRTLARNFGGKPYDPRNDMNSTLMPPGTPRSTDGQITMIQNLPPTPGSAITPPPPRPYRPPGATAVTAVTAGRHYRQTSRSFSGMVVAGSGPSASALSRLSVSSAGCTAGGTTVLSQPFSQPYGRHRSRLADTVTYNDPNHPALRAIRTDSGDRLVSDREQSGQTPPRGSATAATAVAARAVTPRAPGQRAARAGALSPYGVMAPPPFFMPASTVTAAVAVTDLDAHHVSAAGLKLRSPGHPHALMAAAAARASDTEEVTGEGSAVTAATAMVSPGATVVLAGVVPEGQAGMNGTVTARAPGAHLTSVDSSSSIQQGGTSVHSVAQWLPGSTGSSSTAGTGSTMYNGAGHVPRVGTVPEHGHYMPAPGEPYGPAPPGSTLPGSTVPEMYCHYPPVQGAAMPVMPPIPNPVYSNTQANPVYGRSHAMGMVASGPPMQDHVHVLPSGEHIPLMSHLPLSSGANSKDYGDGESKGREGKGKRGKEKSGRRHRGRGRDRHGRRRPYYSSSDGSSDSDSYSTDSFSSSDAGGRSADEEDGKRRLRKGRSSSNRHGSNHRGSNRRSNRSNRRQETAPMPQGKEHPRGEAGLARVKRVIASFKPAHVADLGQMFDPLALLIMWLFNIALAGVGIWQLSHSLKSGTITKFDLNSPLRGNPYLVVASLWALYNSVPPYLFLHYCFSTGGTFKFMTHWLPSVTTLMIMTATALLWLMIPTDFSPASVMDLAWTHFYPNQVVLDTNSNYLFHVGPATEVYLPALLSRGLNVPLGNAMVIGTTGGLSNATTGGISAAQAAAIDWSTFLLPSTGKPVDLSGGIMPGLEHSKNSMLIAYSLSMLAWGAMAFGPGAGSAIGSGTIPLGSGFTPVQLQGLKTTLRTGADYLMRCNLNPTDPANPVFVAQLGDQADYALVDETGFDPIGLGKVWTSPSEDPNLTGGAQRRAWLMTREAVGADLLAQAAGALAATSILLKTDDPSFAAAALAHAQYLYSFATSDLTTPKSYCRFVPCAANVTVTRQVTVKQRVDDYTGTPKCYYADWITKTCRTGMTTKECDKQRAQTSEVFTTKLACCNMFVNSKVWEGLYTKAQGICALPDDQYTCYVPDYAQRTCYSRTIAPDTGAGCAGNGLEVFAYPLTCCNYLNKLTIIDVAGGRLGTGLCSRTGTDTNFTKCWIPNVTNGTCDEMSGAACGQYGADTSFDQPVACCTRLLYLLKDVGTVGKQQVVPNGVCKLYTAPPPPRATLTPDAPAGAGTTTGDTPAAAPAGVPTAAPTADPAAGGNAAAPAGDTAAPAGNAAAPAGDAAAPAANAAAPAGADAAGRRLIQGGIPALAPSTRRGVASVSSPVTNHPARLARALKQSTTSSDQLAALLAQLMAGTGGSASPPSSSTIDNSTQYKLLDPNDLISEDPCAKGDCTSMRVNQEVEVPFYNSTSVMDDLAWGALWLYKATKDAMYLGDAQHFMDRHYLEDVTESTLKHSREYYVPTWDNMAWAVNTMLAQLTDQATYHSRVRSMLNAWVFGDSLPTTPLTPITDIVELTSRVRNYKNFTDAASNITYDIMPSCVPTALYEDACFDGKDNDCDGFVDREDVDCGLFPVLYTPKGVAYSTAPTLPHVANAAFLALTYSSSVSSTEATRLRCWALGQTSHMIGAGADMRSYVVGYGHTPPTIVQHRASSCPAPLVDTSSATNTSGQIAPGRHLMQGAPPPATTKCTWSNAYYPTSDNPQLYLIQGALVAGPGLNDDYDSARWHAATRATVHENVGFTGVLAGLSATNTRLRSCEGLHGVWQKYIEGEDKL